MNPTIEAGARAICEAAFGVGSWESHVVRHGVFRREATDGYLAMVEKMTDNELNDIWDRAYTTNTLDGGPMANTDSLRAALRRVVERAE